jgi:hypothetical protein
VEHEAGESIPYQGKKSTVCLTSHHGMPCIFKRYNERGGSIESKKRREVGFYRYYDGCPVIPRLISSEYTDGILIERLPGVPLNVAFNRTVSDSYEPIEDVADLERVSFEYGKLLATLMESHPQRAILDDYFDCADPCAQIQSVIDTARLILREQPSFAVVAGTLGELESLKSHSSESILCKLDWNPGNVLFDNASITGLIDFEQAFVGTVEIFWGTVLDHISFLDWKQVHAGAGSRTRRMPSFDGLREGGFFSMWYKLGGAYIAGTLGQFAPEKMAAKFERIATSAADTQ